MVKKKKGLTGQNLWHRKSEPADKNRRTADRMDLQFRENSFGMDESGLMLMEEEEKDGTYTSSTTTTTDDYDDDDDDDDNDDDDDDNDDDTLGFYRSTKHRKEPSTLGEWSLREDNPSIEEEEEEEGIIRDYRSNVFDG
ncbi:hypothetical protein M0802_007147 [Mischocyttarus mexicanus]|nr:hypothetical protein M0802_007147 [Mischocyttarus mexicanus]